VFAAIVSGVPLADDLSYTGPVASFTDAAAFRAMAATAGPMVTALAIRHVAKDEVGQGRAVVVGE
jgi:hypothetical protein